MVTASAPSTAGAALRFGGLTFKVASPEVRRGGVSVALTAIELKPLHEFAAAPGRALTRGLLLRRVRRYVWYGDTRVVDMAVQRLRAETGRERIETARGFGHRLRA